jgi:hypothetical protein
MLSLLALLARVESRVPFSHVLQGQADNLVLQ